MDQKIIIHGDKKTYLVQNNSMICSNNNIYTDKPNLKSNVKNTNIVDPNIIGVINTPKCMVSKIMIEISIVKDVISKVKILIN
jgi:hypothetical protein